MLALQNYGIVQEGERKMTNWRWDHLFGSQRIIAGIGDATILEFSLTECQEEGDLSCLVRVLSP